MAQERPNKIDVVKPPCNCEETTGMLTHVFNPSRIKRQSTPGRDTSATAHMAELANSLNEYGGTKDW